MAVPAHILRFYGLQPDATVAAVIDATQELSFSIPFLLSSQESRDEFRRILESNSDHTFDELPAYNCIEEYWQTKIHVTGSHRATVARFSSTNIRNPPPSELEGLLLSYWKHTPTFLIANWPDEVIGKSIVQQLVPASSEDHLTHVFSAALSESAVLPHLSPLLQASEIFVSDLMRFKKDTFALKLVAQAFGENNPKWRFLSLYRIVENGYLHSVLEKLIGDFYSDPKGSLELALDTAKNEVKMLREHATERRLEPYFDEFENTFQNLVAEKGSDFCQAIDRATSEHAADLWKRGVNHYYKIRCSIAHAGSAGVYAERYKSWRTDLEKLLPTAERLALTSLQVTVT